MTGLDLLESYPKAGQVVKQWFLEKMLEGLKDENLPEDFKKYVREHDIDDDKIGKLIDSSPRALFDVFDENDVYIETVIDTDYNFWWKIGDIQSPIGYARRKDADRAAIIEAFKLLNEKL
jgi:hypothetical protein